MFLTQFTKRFLNSVNIYERKMANQKINLFDLKGGSDSNDGLDLIIKLQLFGALPTEQKCNRGHKMTLVKDASVIDKYKWKCRENKTKRIKHATIGKYKINKFKKKLKIK